MAQAGSAQREPSMEEILASIRRIIEDSDLGPKLNEGSDVVRADNDAKPTSLAPASGLEPKAGPILAGGEPRPAMDPRKSEPARIIDVDAFRAELRSDSAIADPPRSMTLAAVQAQFEADRDAARTLAEAEYGDRLSFDLAPETATVIAAADTAVSADGQRTADDWRLGVSPSRSEIPVAEPEAAVVGQARDMVDAVAEIDDFELDLSDFEAMSAPAEIAHQPADAEAGSQPSRPVLISDQAGKKVAAAFGELSEAFAARSRKNLDEMAEEMLRPMLQDWLDNNLPLMVERLVREEIERIARG